MLPKGNDDVRKDLLQSIVTLKDNPDFEVVMGYLEEAGQHCAAQACIQQDDGLAKKCAGGFITINELRNLIETAEKQLDPIKKRIKQQKNLNSY